MSFNLPCSTDDGVPKRRATEETATFDLAIPTGDNVPHGRYNSKRATSFEGPAITGNEVPNNRLKSEEPRTFVIARYTGYVLIGCDTKNSARSLFHHKAYN